MAKSRFALMRKQGTTMRKKYMQPQVWLFTFTQSDVLYLSYGDKDDNIGYWEDLFGGSNYD